MSVLVQAPRLGVYDVTEASGSCRVHLLHAYLDVAWERRAERPPVPRAEVRLVFHRHGQWAIEHATIAQWEAAAPRYVAPSSACR